MEHHAVHVSPLHWLTAQNIFRQIMSPGKKTKFGVLHIHHQHRRCVLCFGVPLLISNRKLRYTPRDYTDIKKTIHTARQKWDNFGKTPVTFLFERLFPIKVSQSEGPVKSVAFRRFNQSIGEWVKMTFVINTATGVIQLPMCHIQRIKKWKGNFEWSSLKHPETSSVFGLGVS